MAGGVLLCFACGRRMREAINHAGVHVIVCTHCDAARTAETEETTLAKLELAAHPPRMRLGRSGFVVITPAAVEV